MLRECRFGFCDPKLCIRSHAESLVEAIMSAGCVKKLDLSHNRLTWVAVSNFADMLTSKPRQLGGPQTQLAELKVRSTTIDVHRIYGFYSH
jgi:hypothetical protein